MLRYGKDDTYFNLIKERKADILKIYNSFRSYEDIIVSSGHMRSHYRWKIGKACESFIPFFEQPNNFADVQLLSETTREKFQDGLTDCYNRIVERQQTGGSLTPFERMSKYVDIQTQNPKSSLSLRSLKSLITISINSGNRSLAFGYIKKNHR